MGWNGRHHIFIQIQNGGNGLLIIQDEGVPCGFAEDLLWIGSGRSCLENPWSGSRPSLRNCCSWVSPAQDFDGVGCNYGIWCYGCTWHKQVTPAPPIEMIIFTYFHCWVIRFLGAGPTSGLRPRACRDLLRGMSCGHLQSAGLPMSHEK